MNKIMDRCLDIVPKFGYSDEIELGILAWYEGDLDLLISDVEHGCNFIKGLVAVEKINRQKTVANNDDQKRQIATLTQLITGLQSQIQELEKKLTSNSNSQQLSNRLSSLKQRQQQIKSQLNQKQEWIKKSNDNQNQQASSTEDKFNWLWVIIPMGTAIILLLGIVIFQNRKKKN